MSFLSLLDLHEEHMGLCNGYYSAGWLAGHLLYVIVVADDILDTFNDSQYSPTNICFSWPWKTYPLMTALFRCWLTLSTSLPVGWVKGLGVFAILYSPYSWWSGITSSNNCWSSITFFWLAFHSSGFDVIFRDRIPWYHLIQWFQPHVC